MQKEPCCISASGGSVRARNEPDYGDMFSGNAPVRGRVIVENSSRIDLRHLGQGATLSIYIESP